MSREEYIRELERKLAESEKGRLQAELKIKPTQFLPCVLFRHHLLLSRLSLDSNPANLTKGKTTDVRGKFYPKTLTKWTEFPTLHEEKFQHFCEVFGDKELFPSFFELFGASQTISDSPIRSEAGLRPFHLQFQAAIKNFFSEYRNLVSPEPRTAVTFRSEDDGPQKRDKSDFNNPASSTAPPLAQSSTAVSVSSRSLQPSPVVSSGPTKPDVWAFRVEYAPSSTTVEDVEEEGGQPKKKSEAIYVQDYKALHKVPPQAVLDLLGNDAPQISLVADLRRIGLGSRTNSPSPQNPRAEIRSNIASSLAQNFHYMIEYGLRYSCISTGQGLILLYFNPETPTIVYYHLCTPKADVVLPRMPENNNLSAMMQFAVDNRDALSNTAFAKLMTFTALAWPYAPQANEWDATLTHLLKRWPEAYDGAESPVSSRSSSRKRRNDDDSDRPGRASRPPPPPSSLSESRSMDAAPGQGMSQTTAGNQDQQRDLPTRGRVAAPQAVNIGTRRPPLRFYCTHACLNGLRTSGPLDPNCPNLAYHLRQPLETPADKLRAQAHNTLHPISNEELLDKVREQLSVSIVDDWDSLDKYGMWGAIGVMFKLTLREYGYTLMAKGVQFPDKWRLGKELSTYNELEDLQGRSIPVCLGTVDMVKEYRLYNGVRIQGLLLMSFGGLNFENFGNLDQDITDKANEIIAEIRERGIEHGDVRTYNFLWNPKTSTVMAVDFERAYKIQPQKREPSPSLDSSSPVKRGRYDLWIQSLEEAGAHY